jgi:two-component system sensor histidine kinase CpxA
VELDFLLSRGKRYRFSPGGLQAVGAPKAPTPMKLTLTLTHKVALWLLINLAVLLAAGAGFMAVRYGIGWTSLIAGPAGEKVRNLSVLIAAELRADPGQDLDALLAIHQIRGTQFTLFVEDGEQLGGASLHLPRIVQDELGPRQPPPGLDRPGPGGPDMPGQAPGFFFHQTDGPVPYWIGLRLPVREAGRPQPSRGTLLIAVPSTWRLVLLLEFGPWFAAVGVAFVLSVLCWLPFVTSLRHDLLALTHATEHLAEGRFDTRVPATRRDELGALGTAVNCMAERLDLHAQGQRQFLGDVAHELGSPIARLQVAIELLERRAAADQHEAIGDVREEVQQMANLVNELLAFTQAGLRSRAPSLKTVELNTLMHGVIAQEGATERVNLALPPNCLVQADATLLRRALANLVRNALRYGARDRPILITSSQTGQTTLVTIADEGPGVPPESLSRLGEPFFRPEVARTRESGGVGLGLTIVRSAIAACEGQVEFLNRTPRGFVAQIQLRAGPGTITSA